MYTFKFYIHADIVSDRKLAYRNTGVGSVVVTTGPRPKALNMVKAKFYSQSQAMFGPVLTMPYR